MSKVSSSNQHTSDEREQKCWDFYVATVSSGCPNAYQSAIKAEYSKDHAENITLQGWFKERNNKLIRKDMLSKAEKVLDKTLSYNAENEEGVVKTDLLRIQTDVAKHITKTLGKDEGYSEKTETELSIVGVELSEEQAEQLIRARANRGTIQRDS
jgi:hypothetical protein